MFALCRKLSLNVIYSLLFRSEKYEIKANMVEKSCKCSLDDVKCRYYCSQSWQNMGKHICTSFNSLWLHPPRHWLLFNTGTSLSPATLTKLQHLCTPHWDFVKECRQTPAHVQYHSYLSLRTSWISSPASSNSISNPNLLDEFRWM